MLNSMTQIIVNYDNYDNREISKIVVLQISKLFTLGTIEFIKRKTINIIELFTILCSS